MLVGGAALAVAGLYYFGKFRLPGRRSRVRRRTKSVQVDQPERFLHLEKLQEATGITVERLEDVLERWKKQAKTAVLSRAEFGKVLRSLHVEDGHTIESIFRAWDINSDGQIDLNELLFGFLMSTSSSHRQKVKFLFQLADNDHDGFVNLEEVIGLYQTFIKYKGLELDEKELSKNLTSAFNEADHTHDQALNLDGESLFKFVFRCVNISKRFVFFSLEFIGLTGVDFIEGVNEDLTSAILDAFGIHVMQVEK